MSSTRVSMSIIASQQVMTPNAEERREQAPRLLVGSYASWRPRMDVWLEKGGASGVHKKEMSEERWKIADASVQAWEEEAEADAWSALSLGAPAVPASSVADSSSMPPPDASRHLLWANCLMLSRTVAR